MTTLYRGAASVGRTGSTGLFDEMPSSVHLIFNTDRCTDITSDGIYYIGFGFELVKRINYRVLLNASVLLKKL